MHRRARRTVVLLGLAAALSACASIPLGTLWRLRSYSPEDILALDPGAVRAAVALDPGVRLRDPAASLRLTAVTRDGERLTWRFALVASRQRAAGLPALARDGLVWHVVAPAAGEPRRLAAARDELVRRRPELAELSVEVSASFEHIPEGLERRFPIAIALRLAPGGEWLALVRPTRMDLEAAH